MKRHNWQVRLARVALIFLFVLIGGATSYLPLASAQTCNLPVCDLQAAIDQLRYANQSGRFDIVRKLRDTYRTSQDVAIAQNLALFADQAKILFVTLKEDDWLVREADYLADQSRVQLLKFRAPEIKGLNADFDRIQDPARRFEAITYWVTESVKLTDQKQLQALIAFGEHARVWSVSTNQDAYFERESVKLIEAASRALATIFPSYEGSYHLIVTCSPRPDACGVPNMKIDQLVVFDSVGPNGLVVSLGSEAAHQSHYIYFNSVYTKNAQSIRSGDSPRWVHPSEAVFTVNPVSGAVVGDLRDATNNGVLHFVGVPQRRTLPYYTDAGPRCVLGDQDVIGRYRGTLGTMSGDLVIHKFDLDKWKATFVSTSGVQKDFAYGAFQPSRGVMSLSYSASFSMEETKLVLAVRPTKTGDVWEGFMMLSAGQVLPASFKQLPDVLSNHF